MCGRRSEALPGEPRGARRARELVAETCGEWQLEPICDDVVLPVSELVTNAILHARTGVELTMCLTAEFVEVSVRDHHPRPPMIRPVQLNLDRDFPDPLDPHTRPTTSPDREPDAATTGRGLHIVDAIADEWGVAELAEGKDVWFRVATPPGWQPLEACPCTSSPERTPGGLPIAVSARYRRDPDG